MMGEVIIVVVLSMAAVGSAMAAWYFYRRSVDAVASRDRWKDVAESSMSFYRKHSDENIEMFKEAARDGEVTIPQEFVRTHERQQRELADLLESWGQK
jgi:hypothetical protein